MFHEAITSSSQPNITLGCLHSVCHSFLLQRHRWLAMTVIIVNRWTKSLIYLISCLLQKKKLWTPILLLWLFNAGSRLAFKSQPSEVFHSGLLPLGPARWQPRTEIPSLAAVSAESHRVLLHIRVFITVRCKFRIFDMFIFFPKEPLQITERREQTTGLEISFSHP